LFKAQNRAPDHDFVARFDDHGSTDLQERAVLFTPTFWTFVREFSPIEL